MMTSLQKNLSSLSLNDKNSISKDEDSDNDSISFDSDYDSDDNETANDSVLNNNEEDDLLTFFSSKELCYYKMIDKYYKTCKKDEIIEMISIIESTSEISLRILDWFVTRYSKRRFEINIGNGTEIFDVHISYKSQLKSYKKRYFDPFRRRKKFRYQLIADDTTSQIVTTLGQLNFFRWAINNNIIHFVKLNLPQIIKAMNVSNKKDKVKKEEKRKKREERKNLSDSEKNKKNIKGNINFKATKTTNDEEVQIIISFDD